MVYGAGKHIGVVSIYVQPARQFHSLLQANLSSVGHRVTQEEQSIALARILEQLSTFQAEAIVLKHCQGMSVDEICRHMNKTPDAVGGLLRHGMRKLRELMPGEE